MSKIKSFRGQMKDGAVDQVFLHTNDGSTGYRITKISGIAKDPGTVDAEHVFKIYKTPQTTATAEIDFSDNTLVAIMYYTNRNDTLQSGMNVITFENEIFNQDLYITHNEIVGAGTSGTSGNYYIELEQFKLDLSNNTMATLKDIRNETLAL
jgi:hypothetical protein